MVEFLFQAIVVEKDTWKNFYTIKIVETSSALFILCFHAFNLAYISANEFSNFLAPHILYLLSKVIYIIVHICS